MNDSYFGSITWSHFTWLALVPLLSEMLGISDVWFFSLKKDQGKMKMSPFTLKHGKMSQLNSISIHEWNQWFFPASQRSGSRSQVGHHGDPGLLGLRTMVHGDYPFKNPAITSWYCTYHIIHIFFVYIPGGAGFLPSTLLPIFFSTAVRTSKILRVLYSQVREWKSEHLGQGSICPEFPGIEDLRYVTHIPGEIL